MGFPVYKSTSNPTPPDETSNPTPPPTSQPPVSRSVSRSSRLSSRARTRQRLRHRRRATLSSSQTDSLLIPSEFLSSSYNRSRASRAPISSETPSKAHNFVLVLTSDTTSNRTRGSYRMSVTTYTNKMSFNIPHSILVNLSTPSRTNALYNHFTSGSLDDVPVEDPGFVSDNESTTSEDSILSDPEWISTNRELAMELLLGSSEDEFLGSLLGPGSYDDLSQRVENRDNDMVLYEDDEMDLDMGEADDEDEEETEMETQEANTRSTYVLRQVDEDYDL